MKILCVLVLVGIAAGCVTENTQATECADGVRNGKETGVDCGGGVCLPCAAHLACKAPADCRSALCDADLCQPLPAPGIASFTAASRVLTVGGSTTVTAVFSDGNAVLSPGGAVVSNQPVSVGPFNTPGETVYTLTVDDGSNVAMTQTLTITAVPPASIASFEAQATQVPMGSSTLLTAVFSDGNGVVSPAVGAVQSGVAASSGELTADTKFILTVTNPAGDAVTKDVQVSVSPGPLVAQFVVDSSAVLAGQTVRLTATFDAGAGGSASIDGGVGAVTSGVAVTTPAVTADTNFVLTVQNGAGMRVTRGLVVTARRAADCMEAQALGLAANDGVYPVGPSVAQLHNVWCDTTTDGGGWTRLYHGKNGAAYTVASFEGSDTCADPNANCLQHMPTAVPSDVQLLVACGASSLRFSPTAATVTYLKAGTVAGWQHNDHIVSLQGGHVAAGSAFLAGDAQGAGWMLNVTGDLAVPQVYANATHQAAVALQGCGGAPGDGNALSLAYRVPTRLAQTLDVRATAVAGVDDVTPVEVRMLDQYGEVLTTAANTITLSSSDTAAVLPSSAPLVNGVLAQNVTLKTAGAQWLNASTGLEGGTLNVRVVAGAIGTVANPAASCLAILAAGASAGDGTYQLTANSSALNAYCDMTTDGGGWTLLMATGGRGPALLRAGPVWPNAPGALPVATAQALAQTATQVHVRSARAAGTQSMTSTAGSQPLTNLQQGVQLSSGTYDGSQWTGPYSAAQYTEFDATCTADPWPAVYRACGHAGLQLAGQDTRWLDHSGDLYSNGAIEVYVR